MNCDVCDEIHLKRTHIAMLVDKAQTNTVGSGGMFSLYCLGQLMPVQSTLNPFEYLSAADAVVSYIPTVFPDYKEFFHYATCYNSKHFLNGLRNMTKIFPLPKSPEYDHIERHIQ